MSDSWCHLCACTASPFSFLASWPRPLPSWPWTSWGSCTQGQPPQQDLVLEGPLTTAQEGRRGCCPKLLSFLCYHKVPLGTPADQRVPFPVSVCPPPMLKSRGEGQRLGLPLPTTIPQPACGSTGRWACAGHYGKMGRAPGLGDGVSLGSRAVPLPCLIGGMC